MHTDIFTQRGFEIENYPVMNILPSSPDAPSEFELRIQYTALHILAVARRQLVLQEIAWDTTLSACDNSIGTVSVLTRLVDPARVVA
jgi:hypothetical protein